MSTRPGKLFEETRGATTIEYGMILALIVLVLIAALYTLAGVTIGMWNDVARNVTTAA